MKKETKIIKDKRQTRTTIPAEFVKSVDIKTGDVMIWEMEKTKLKGTVKKNG